MRRVMGLMCLVAFTMPVGRIMGMPVQKDQGTTRSPSPLDRLVTVQLRNVPLQRVLTEIDRQAKLGLAYTTEIVPLERQVTLDRSRVTAGAALREVLQGMGVTAEVTHAGRVTLVKTVRADTLGKISGRVTAAANGTPIVGASVTVVGTALSVVTGDGGLFALERVPLGERSVMVRFIGFLPLTKKVLVDSVPLRLDFAVEARAAHMDELVSTATGQQRRRDLGNAITTINADSVLQAAPIRNLSDLLENRVPGLTQQHTSGAPGDPTRMRLRGLGSVLRSNDPVVIIDGVRVYAAQSETRSGNLTNASTLSAKGGGLVRTNSAAPSPLDQIDPNIIDKIEVFKGPSAATLYGADAANGVIVITTKQGRPGPTRWGVNTIYGRTSTLGRYPEGYYRWGHGQFNNAPVFCALVETLCIQDSLVRFQALNDPNLSVLGRGRLTSYSLTTSGGNQALTYSVTGSYSDEIGLVKLPGFEVERFRTRFNQEAPEWMQRPHHYKIWSVSSRMQANLGPTAAVTLSTSVRRSEQQRSTLESALANLARTYVDTINGIYYRPSQVSQVGGELQSTLTSTPEYLDAYYKRTTASTLTFTTGLNGSWRPSSWFTATGQAGIDVIPREDEVLLPAALASVADSGALIRGTGRSMLSTFNLQGTARKALRWGLVFETSAGANVNTTNTDDLVSTGVGLVPGTTSITGAKTFQVIDRRVSSSSFGWYIEPRLVGQRLSLSTGIRLDGGSAYGSRVSGVGGGLLGLPKLNASWVISEEPFFPFKSLFSSLRLRGAYGQAQVQPGPADRFRLYRFTLTGTPSAELTDSLGNTQLRPERSKEFEGGFDADLLDNRLSVEFTAYRKTKVDALMVLSLPQSVNGGGSVIQNIGNIVNTGMELTVGFRPIQLPSLTWSTDFQFSRNNNKLVKLGRGVLPNYQQGLVEGYPIYGRWAKPILGYDDRNNSGAIDVDEVIVGDSMVYMGRLEPAYSTALHTNLRLFGGAVSASASFSYDAGETQIDQTARINWVLAGELFDPTTPHGEQAATLASVARGGSQTDYGLIQDISTFRFNSLSVNYRAPNGVARLLRAQQLMVAVQGANLGIHTTYKGRDPDVNSWSTGEGIVDGGQLARPRTWQVRVDLQY